MKKITIEHEITLSDEQAKIYSDILNSLNIKHKVYELENVPTLRSFVEKNCLSLRARNQLGKLANYQWNMSLEYFLHKYSFCEFSKMYGVGETTITEVKIALLENGHNWCQYCKKYQNFLNHENL